MQLCSLSLEAFPRSYTTEVELYGTGMRRLRKRAGYRQ
jgi:hypothetical protein